MVNNITYEPAIKWSGSKRSQANSIISYFPKEIDTYYEPFCGGASIMMRLFTSDIHITNYVISDLNKDLINLWKFIQSNPIQVANHYELLWNELNKYDDIEYKKNYFNVIRDRYNECKNPLDFMFIMRTTTNGMPRYNKNGEFNNSFHCTRNGISPNKLKDILLKWSELLNKNRVKFMSCSYETIIPNKNDFVYFDSPYFNTKGMYYGAIDYDVFWKYLKNLQCSYAMSFDGVSGDVDNTFQVSKDVYDKHEYILSGNSSFKRIMGKSNDCIVYESLYLKGCNYENEKESVVELW